MGREALFSVLFPALLTYVFPRRFVVRIYVRIFSCWNLRTVAWEPFIANVSSLWTRLVIRKDTKESVRIVNSLSLPLTLPRNSQQFLAGIAKNLSFLQFGSSPTKNICCFSQPIILFLLVIQYNVFSQRYRPFRCCNW